MLPKGWSQIRGLQKQKYVRGMYFWLFLVPITAKLLQSVPESLDFPFYGEILTIGTRLPFSWPMLYLSALLFVVSHLFWFIFCPAIIKEHENYTSFDADGKGLRELKSYCSQENLDWKHIESLAQKSHPLYKPCLGHQEIPIDVKLTFAEIYAVNNKLRPRARHCSFGFYVLGAILLVAVVIDNTISVVNIILR